MKKIIAITMVLILAITFLGCTSPPDTNDTNTAAEFTVNNQTEADQTLNDVSTDLGGISNSLDEIDSTLTK